MPSKVAPSLKLSAHDQIYFERLKAWRLDEARTSGVPAYVVFKDITLYQLAIKKPQTLAELLWVEGIGDKKIQTYGEAVLALLR